MRYTSPPSFGAHTRTAHETITKTNTARVNVHDTQHATEGRLGHVNSAKSRHAHLAFSPLLFSVRQKEVASARLLPPKKNAAESDEALDCQGKGRHRGWGGGGG
jgi:hypothetical protein